MEIRHATHPVRSAALDTDQRAAPSTVEQENPRSPRRSPRAGSTCWWAPHNVQVNAIAPGYIATDDTADLRADPDREPSIRERIPAGRWGTPSDVVGAAVFLSSPASDYVNGHVLVIDGGWLGR